MIRRFAALALSTTLVLAALAATPVVAADSAPLPSSIAGVGDSITQAASSDGSLGVDAPRNSWSTGDNSTVNSHYLRLVALNQSVTAHNHSVSGAKVGGLATQMESLATVKPDYVTVLIGGNDLCTDTIDEMTPTSVFRDQFYVAMEKLLGDTDTGGVSPDSNVYVVSIPDVHQLWELFRNNVFARAVWSAGNICQSLLANPTSNKQADVERRAAFRQRNIEYNTQLAAVCALFARCHWDGNTVFDYKFSRSDVAGDYFHPSIEGQANLAAETWAAGYTWTTGGDQNADPTAGFSFSCTDLTCSFDGTGSSDGDGTITGYSWDFGDPASDTDTSTDQKPSYTYPAGGTYTVVLTVTDNEGGTDSASQSVTVTAESTTITLSATAYKVKGVQHADLSWSPFDPATSVDVYRNTSKIVTTANDGFHTDNIGEKGGGSYTYKVCQAGTSTCSNEVTVSY